MDNLNLERKMCYLALAYNRPIYIQNNRNNRTNEMQKEMEYAKRDLIASTQLHEL